MLARSGPVGGSEDQTAFPKLRRALNLKLTRDEAKKRRGLSCILEASWSSTSANEKIVHFHRLREGCAAGYSIIEFCDV